MMDFSQLLLEAKKHNQLIPQNEIFLAGKKIQVDQSSFGMPDEIIKQFNTYIGKNDFIKNMAEIMSGKICNFTEGRSASHFMYRQEDSILYKQNISRLIDIVNRIDEKYDQIIFFGIGGSFLGPMLLNDAFGTNEKQILFVTGSDPEEYMHLKDNDLSKTAFVLASKSFSTIETLLSYQYMKSKNHQN